MNLYIFHKNIMLHLFMKKSKKVKKMGQKEKHSERNWKIQISEKKK